MGGRRDDYNPHTRHGRVDVPPPSTALRGRGLSPAVPARPVSAPAAVRSPAPASARPGAVATASPEGPVILFLVDNSASLPPLDPDEQRVAALEKMFAFLKGQPYRLILFGGREEIYVDDVSRYHNDGQWTDFYFAFEKAQQLIREYPPGTEFRLVLLTDAIVDPGPTDWLDQGVAAGVDIRVHSSRRTLNLIREMQIPLYVILVGKAPLEGGARNPEQAPGLVAGDGAGRERGQGLAPGPDPRVVLLRRRDAPQEVRLPRRPHRGPQEDRADRGPRGRAVPGHRGGAVPERARVAPGPVRRPPAGRPRALLSGPRRRGDRRAVPGPAGAPLREPAPQAGVRRLGGHRPRPRLRRQGRRVHPDLSGLQPGPHREGAGHRRDGPGDREAVAPPPGGPQAGPRAALRTGHQGREDLHPEPRLRGQELRPPGGRAPAHRPRGGSQAHLGPGFPEGQGPPGLQRVPAQVPDRAPRPVRQLRQGRRAEGAEGGQPGAHRPVRLHGPGRHPGRPEGRPHRPPLRPGAVPARPQDAGCRTGSSRSSASAGAATAS